jgi:hypothetical protein
MKTNQRFLTFMLGLMVLGGYGKFSYAADGSAADDATRDIEQDIIGMIEPSLLGDIIKQLNVARDTSSISDLILTYLQALPSTVPDMLNTQEEQKTIEDQFAVIDNALDRSDIKKNSDISKLVWAARAIVALHFTSSFDPKDDATFVLPNVFDFQRNASSLLATLKEHDDLRIVLRTWLMDSFQKALNSAGIRGKKELDKGNVEIVGTLLEQARNSKLDTDATTMLQELFIKRLSKDYELATKKQMTTPQTPTSQQKPVAKKKWWQLKRG